MKKLLLFTGLLFGFITNAQQLDVSFNTTGYNAITLANFADYSKGIHQQSTGKYVVTSVSGQGSANYDYYAMRFNVNGTLDTTFGTNGQSIANFGTGYDELLGSTLQPDGKIIMVGGTSFNSAVGFGIVRLTTDGQLDTTFNGTGKLYLPLNGNAYAYKVIVAANNKIMISGSTTSSAVIIRLNSDGTFDTSFDTDGKVEIPNRSAFRDFIIDSQNDIIAVYTQQGAFFPTQVQGKALIAKFDNSGALVTSFGVNGIVDLSLSGNLNPSANQIKLLSNGQYLILGANDISSPYQSRQFLTKLNVNGSIDSSFGDIGFLYFLNMSFAPPLVKNNSIYLTGTKRNTFPTPNEEQIFKLNENGTFDIAFGTNGIYTETTPNLNFGFALEIDSQNKLIVALQEVIGSGSGPYTHKSGMARYGIGTLSNNTFNLSNNLKIFPNPTTGNFNIAIDENLVGANVSVYNVLGQKVKTFSLDNVTTNQNLESGMYILEIEKEGNKISRKLIVN